MGRIGTAFKAFIRALSDAAFAARVRLLLDTPAIAEPAASQAPVTPPKPTPTRSEALTLLDVLQREARLVDFLKENITGYTDDQIGAAVREIHRDAAAALERIFSLRPIRSENEGGSVTVPADYDAGRIRLVGNVTGQPPHTGTLVHAGWEATTADVPEWTGAKAAAKVVAPAEVELS